MPQCGPSGSVKLHHQVVMRSRSLPRVTWNAWRGAENISSLCGSADLPIPAVVFLACSYTIPAATTAVTADDMDPVQKDGDVKDKLSLGGGGGFRASRGHAGSHCRPRSHVVGTRTTPVLPISWLLLWKEPVKCGQVGRQVTGGLGRRLCGQCCWVGPVGGSL